MKKLITLSSAIILSFPVALPSVASTRVSDNSTKQVKTHQNGAVKLAGFGNFFRDVRRVTDELDQEKRRSEQRREREARRREREARIEAARERREKIKAERDAEREATEERRRIAAEQRRAYYESLTPEQKREYDAQQLEKQKAQWEAFGKAFEIYEAYDSVLGGSSSPSSGSLCGANVDRTTCRHESYQHDQYLKRQRELQRQNNRR